MKDEQQSNKEVKEVEWKGLTPEDWQDKGCTLAFREGAEWAEEILRERNSLIRSEK